MNPGRFAPITCSLRVDSPHLIAIIYYYRWSLFRQFLVIIYLLLVCKKKKKIHSFWSTLNIYLLVVYKKNNNSFILVYFNYLSKISSETFLAKFTKNHTRTVKRLVFFVPTQKCMKWLRCCTIVQITSFLMNYTSNAKII